MLKLLADENFDNTIVRGLWRRNSNIDIVKFTIFLCKNYTVTLREKMRSLFSVYNKVIPED
jgi:hypothetical protein